MASRSGMGWDRVPEVRLDGTGRRRMWQLLGAVLACAGSVHTAAAAPQLRIGGSLGFGLTAQEKAGEFDWDWNSAREDTQLVELHFGFVPRPALTTFIAFGARLDASRDLDAPRFELREAAVRYTWKRARGDSLVLGYFARQPPALWLDHGLGSPLNPIALGENVQGARVDLRWKALVVAALAADASDSDPVSGPAQDGDAFVLRARGDWPRAAGMRLGGTFLRHLPQRGPTTGDPAAVDVERRDLAAVDLRFLLQGVQLLLDYSQVDAHFAEPGAAEAQEPGERTSWDFGADGGLRRVMPTTASLQAELRAPALGNARWGWFGGAPAYRLIGANSTNPLAAPLPDPGTPTRGLEGYRVEVWYQAAAWPVWLRQVYDHSTQFRDADRRVVAQVSEIEGRMSPDISGRLRYTQLDVPEPQRTADEFHSTLLAEIRAVAATTRLRGQFALVDADADTRRDLVTVEAGMRVTSHIHAVARASAARDAIGMRRAFFAELQYWHLPQFEFALQYGPDWIGDAADPVLDPDLNAAGDMRGLVRVHLRGWF